MTSTNVGVRLSNHDRYRKGRPVSSTERVRIRTREREGRQRSLGDVLETRRESRVEEFGSRRGGEIVLPV